MSQQLITNFYIPGISKRISTKLRTIKNYSQVMHDKDEKEGWDNSGLPHGDGWKFNSGYKELIEILDISKITNDEIKKEMNICLINDFGIEKSIFTKISDEINNSYNEPITDLRKARILRDTIFHWRRYSYSAPSISLLLSIPKEKVKEILSEYKKNVKIACNKNRRKRKGLRLSVGSDQFQVMKNYWDYPIKRPKKIKDIKEYVWSSNEHEKAPNNSTILRILRNDLKMRYKVLQKRNPITKNANSICLFHEAYPIQVLLRTKNYELIYIDEFSY